MCELEEKEGAKIKHNESQRNHKLFSCSCLSYFSPHDLEHGNLKFQVAHSTMRQPHVYLHQLLPGIRRKQAIRLIHDLPGICSSR